MVSFLRHIAFRIWATVLLGGLVNLAVLPFIQPHLGLENNVLIVAVILLIFFLATGWASNRWALHKADHLMAEAGAFERDGMYIEAEGAFQRAMALFDSFMISPFVGRKRAGGLGARLARFYLSRSRRDHTSEDFLVAYLNSNPQDGEVAQHWLNQVESGGGLKEAHQELALRIGEAQPKNNYIQRTLARFYLLLERADFPALQTYRRVCDGDESVPPEFIDELAKLFVKEKRADEWALDLYLQALARHGERAGYLRGLAACLHWLPVTEYNKHRLQTARQYLQGIDASTLKNMVAGFNPPVPPKPVRKIGIRISPGVLWVNSVRNLSDFIRSMLRRIINQVQKAFNLMRHSRKVRRGLTAVLLLGLATGIGGLVVNTVSHLTVTETPPAKKETDPPIRIITDPFTLQVAAYLKPEYAKNYVQQLKMRGLDAYWSEAVRGDKQWYQVRVSHFATKQAARDYGEKLKSEGIIDDYYVANYRSP
ncbi:MAG: SPOR domain-containing protein [Desulfobacterales bacterium]|nr:MAG: SPOR domain-containing protein [Desulfobacterales bacterium]